MLAAYLYEQVLVKYWSKQYFISRIMQQSLVLLGYFLMKKEKMKEKMQIAYKPHSSQQSL